jgi:hypothetical protein
MAGQSHTAADHLALAMALTIPKLPYKQQIMGLDMSPPH